MVAEAAKVVVKAAATAEPAVVASRALDDRSLSAAVPKYLSVMDI